MSLVRYRLNRDSVEPTLITTCSHRHQLATVAQAAAAAAAIGRLITNGARYLLVPSSSSCQLLVGQIRARSIKLVGAARCSRNGRQFGNNSNHKSATLTSKPLLVGNSIYQGPKKQPAAGWQPDETGVRAALWARTMTTQIWTAGLARVGRLFRALMASVLCVGHLSARLTH